MLPEVVAPLVLAATRPAAAWRCRCGAATSRRQRSSPTISGSGGRPVHREEVATPLQVLLVEAATGEVDVAVVAVDGRAQRDHRPQRRRPTAAICSPLKPPHEMPIIPTRTARPRLRRPTRRSLRDRRPVRAARTRPRTNPSESPMPAMSTRAQANPWAANHRCIASSPSRVPSRRRYGMYSRTTGAGLVRALGRKSRAASRRPSRRGIHAVSTSSTRSLSSTWSVTGPVSVTTDRRGVHLNGSTMLRSRSSSWAGRALYAATGVRPANAASRSIGEASSPGATSSANEEPRPPGTICSARPRR